MYSFSLDYVFNRVYDFLLWIKYTWLFDVLNKNQDSYLEENKNVVWDGLRDRGWFDEYLKQKNAEASDLGVQTTVWERLLNSLGIKLHDSDGDGISDVIDSKPNDASNLTGAQLKERYEADYSFSDKVRDTFGISPKDSDGDGVPNSYEIAHNMNPELADSDRDGIIDGQEIIKGTNPISPDTDSDGVLDGRDEAPLDHTVSSIGPDSDGDGVSNKIENILGSDINKIDTDGDGIFDGMDTYVTDANNVSSYTGFDLSKEFSDASEGLHSSIQNGVLSFLTDIVSVLFLFLLVFLMYVVIRWFIEFSNGIDHYEHGFKHDEHGSHGGSHDKGHGTHTAHHEEEKEEVFSLIPGLAIKEYIENKVEAPKEKDFENHPKWAVVEGYMSSDNEDLWRIGILEADNILRESLAEKGYEGADVGEMLMKANFETIQLAWDAHKVRNRIAHDGSDYTLTQREARRVNSLYEAVFKELKVVK